MKSGDLCSLHSPLFTLLLRVLHAQKILLFDIDGTLSTGLTTMMPESAVKALAQLRANGHFTAIATGTAAGHLQQPLPRATASRTL